MRRVALTMLGATLATRLAGQAFQPPAVRHAEPRGTHLGLYGFGIAGGVDFTGDGQFVFAATLDAGNLFVYRLRVRPSVEIGILNGANTYAGSMELLYRFTPDNQAAMPYAGGGVGLAGHAACGADPDCPAVWVNAVVGLEVRYRSTFNWLLEYHGMNAFRRSRVYVGLTTRRGN